MSQPGNPNSLEHEWQKQIGQPLEAALKQIMRWRKESSFDRLREIGFQELLARAEGYLIFDGTGYALEEGLAEVLLNSALPSTAKTHGCPEQTNASRDDGAFASTVAYDLVHQIVTTNRHAGYPIPEYFEKFANEAPRRPKGKGGNIENNLLRDLIIYWSVQRGVDLGLKPARNPVKARNPHKDKASAVLDLTSDVFASTRWHVEYEAMRQAWMSFRYLNDVSTDELFHDESVRADLKTRNQKKLTKRLNKQIYQFRLKQLDELIPKLAKKAEDSHPK